MLPHYFLFFIFTHLGTDLADQDQYGSMQIPIHNTSSLVKKIGDETSSHNDKPSTFLARQALCRLFLLQDILCCASQHLLLLRFSLKLAQFPFLSENNPTIFTQV